MSRIGIVIVVVLFLVGPVPLVVGAVATWRAWAAHQEEVRAQEGWVEVTAEITECSAFNPQRNSPGQWAYTYKSEWKDAQGVVRPARGSGNSCDKGQRYALQYNPSNPDQFSRPVEAFIPTPLILCLIGGAFTFIALKEWRKARAKPAPM